MLRPTYRFATVEDAQRLLSFWEGVAHGRSVSDNLAAVSAFLGHPTSRCLVAESGDDLVGSVLIGWDGWRLSIYRLAVDPGMRRQGVALELVRAAERHAAQIGAVRVDPMVAADNPDGAAFWRSGGYVANPRYVRFERTVD